MWGPHADKMKVVVFHLRRFKLETLIRRLCAFNELAVDTLFCWKIKNSEHDRQFLLSHKHVVVICTPKLCMNVEWHVLVVIQHV